MHAGQLKVDVATVRELVDQQFPQWRELPVTAVPAQGTENALFWLSERMVARSRSSRRMCLKSAPGCGTRPKPHDCW